jgi:hypothetical protein
MTDGPIQGSNAWNRVVHFLAFEAVLRRVCSNPSQGKTAFGRKRQSAQIIPFTHDVAINNRFSVVGAAQTMSAVRQDKSDTKRAALPAAVAPCCAAAT